MCSKWVHESCTSYSGVGIYVCDFSNETTTTEYKNERVHKSVKLH